MRICILISVVCLQLGWISGVPAGVGVYSYQDSAGNRYGGSYELDDALYFGKAPGATPQRNGIVKHYMDPMMPMQFKPLKFRSFPPIKPLEFKPLEFKPIEFKPLQFKPLEPLRGFTRQAPLEPLPPLSDSDEDATRFGNFGGDFPFMPMSTRNSAFAGGAAGPGFTHQIAALDPESDNPMMRNVNVMNRFADTAKKGGNGFYSVSSSSFASSSDVNGQRSGHRAAETIVNNNGEVTRYKIQS